MALFPYQFKGPFLAETIRNGVKFPQKLKNKYLLSPVEDMKVYGK